jgi:hypothetical protein
MRQEGPKDKVELTVVLGCGSNNKLLLGTARSDPEIYGSGHMTSSDCTQPTMAHPGHIVIRLYERALVPNGTYSRP